MDITKLYKKQISMTEWFQSIDHENSEAFRAEDNTKRARLSVLDEEIGLPIDRIVEFPAEEIQNRTQRFMAYLDQHGDDLCALRLVPRDDALPKLRMRGHTVRKVLDWFAEQDIRPADYTGEFVPHTAVSLWSTIFVVTDQGVFGEIVAGGHHILTQGFYEQDRPITFAFDFETISLSEENPGAREHLRTIMDFLHVPEPRMRKRLQRLLDASFSEDYLQGYFETVCSEEFGVRFIDYNRILGERYKGFSIEPATDRNGLSGQTGSPGSAEGPVRIVPPDSIDTTEFEEGDILVCSMTSPEYLPLMRRAGGIITDLGGILSHAAITSRELGKPCVVGTQNATSSLRNGQRIRIEDGRILL